MNFLFDILIIKLSDIFQNSFIQMTEVHVNEEVVHQKAIHVLQSAELFLKIFYEVLKRPIKVLFKLSYALSCFFGYYCCLKADYFVPLTG